MKIELLEEVDSTNLYIKRYLAERENAIVCSARQTGGLGTKGRSFASSEGGVYFSALVFYRNVPAKNAFRVMTHAAVAVCRTARDFGVNPHIKWPNDVFVADRKLCGILIENGFSENRLDWSITGIGLNAENDLSALGGIAVSLSEAAGRKVSMESAREALVGHFTEESTLEEYLSYVRFLGQTVRVLENGREYTATALRILEDGRLEIDDGFCIRALSAAEISLKIGDRI
jgi:BirA family biotin operon repressor/biotin-[acetyl-CoA-carboxylase] ligase